MAEEKLEVYETPLDQFNKAIRQCWSRETAHPNYQALWSLDNPASGQCAATLVVLADYFPGGKFLKSTEHYHYAYEFRGRVIDLTGEQFGPDAKIVFDTTSDRERLLTSPGAISAGMPERYAMLLARVVAIIGTAEEFWARVDPLRIYRDAGNPLDEMHQNRYLSGIESGGAVQSDPNHIEPEWI